jgi:ABC-2 type transport system permease protein
VRLAWEFFKRDARIALSYKAAFAVQLLGNFLLLGVFYFIGQLIDASGNPMLAPYGGSYLAFILIGLALGDCAGVSLTTFAGQIREGQLTGTLEATLLSPVPLPVILVFSSLWSYFLSAFRFMLYVGLGALLYGVSLKQANVFSTLVIFVLTILCFAGIGILWASVIMLLKRGEAILTTIGFITILVSGVIFPRSLLPSWIQTLSELIPLTHALDAMRLAILHGDGLDALGMVLVKLAVFAVVLPVLGFTAFNHAVTLAKLRGSLVEY